MNMFARFDENQAMTFQDIKETIRYGRTDGRTDGRTHARTDNVKTVYPTTNKVCGGYKDCYATSHTKCLIIKKMIVMSLVTQKV